MRSARSTKNSNPLSPGLAVIPRPRSDDCHSTQSPQADLLAAAGCFLHPSRDRALEPSTPTRAKMLPATLTRCRKTTLTMKQAASLRPRARGHSQSSAEVLSRVSSGRLIFGATLATDWVYHLLLCQLLELITHDGHPQPPQVLPPGRSSRSM